MEKKVADRKEKEGAEEEGEVKKYHLDNKEFSKQVHSLACMIDYLCLKLGQTTNQVMDNAHFDNIRKFEYYNALDRVERTRFISAVPLGFDKKVGQKATSEFNKAVKQLNKVLSGSGTEIKEKGKNDIFDMFGSKENIESFFRDISSGKLPMKQIGKR